MKRFAGILFTPWFLVLAVSLVPLVSLLHPGLPVTHDGQDHVARIANFYASLAEGNLVPRWAANLNWGYGHPILMFLYPLPSYMGSLFHAIGFGFVDSVKLVFAVSFTASMFVMYLWVSAGWGKRAGFVAALLYGFAPYRFVDLYVRGAIGEHVAFVFPPLVMYFLLRLSQWRGKGNNACAAYVAGLGASLAGLILAHNAISLMFLPVFVLYGVYLLVAVRDGILRYVVYAKAGALLGFALSAFFWVPAFFEGKYTLRDIVTAGEAVTRMVPWTWFFVSPWNYGEGMQITKEVGLVQWFGIAAAVGALAVIRRKKDARLTWTIGGFLAIFVGSLFIQTEASAFVWKTVSVLQKFQFPWRFLSVSVFAAAALGGIGVARMLTAWAHATPKRYVLYLPWIMASITALLLVTTQQMWKPRGYLDKPESFFTGIFLSTTDTGESSPIWSIRRMERFPANAMDIAEGQVRIRPGRRTTTVHEYAVSASGAARLVENTLFFPGWKIYVDGMQAGLQYQDPQYRGLMTFRVTDGDHTVRVAFGDTKLRMVANVVSAAGVCILAFLCVFAFLGMFGKRSNIVRR